MKTFNIHTILIFIFSCCTVLSCVKDESQLSDRNGQNFYIDSLNSPSAFEVRQSIDVLMIEPKVVYSGSNDLSYLWRLYNSIGNFVDTIGTEAVLETNIVRPVSTKDVPYIVELQVKENTTGVRAFRRYQVTVSGAVPSGWLVLHENSTGDGTDISLIRSKEIDNSLVADAVLYNIYRAANGESIQGKPKDIFSSTLGNVERELILTDRTMVSVNRSDYRRKFDFEDLFLGESPLPNPLGFLKIGASSVHLSNDNKVFWSRSGSFMGEVVEPTKGMRVTAPYGFSVTGRNGGFYDSLNQRFLYLPANTEIALEFANPTGSVPRFSLDNIGKNLLYVNLGSGLYQIIVGGAVVGSEPYHYAFFEDNDRSKRWFYGLNFYTYTPVPKRDACQIDISSMPDIMAAKFFELGTVGPLAFYATSGKLYSFNYSIENNSVSQSLLSFVVPVGEEITCVKLYKTAGTKLNRVMFVSTWSSSANTGKVYLLDVNPSTGQIGSTPLKVYEGFGKIKEMAWKAN